MRKYLRYKKLVKEHNRILQRMVEPLSKQEGSKPDDVQDLMREILKGEFNLDAHFFKGSSDAYSKLHVLKNALNEFQIELIMTWTWRAALFAAVCAICSLVVTILQVYMTLSMKGV